MLRHALVTISPLFLFACASARTLDVVHGDSIDAPSAKPVETGRELAAPTATALDPESRPVAVEPAVAAPQNGGLHEDRFTLKAGYWGSTEDELDDGYIVNAAWMRFLSKLFALEFELGYMDTDGEEGGVSADVWALPIMVNARLNLPIWVLDVYGGAGLGTFYYDLETDIDDDDGFLLAGNAFLGATINIAEAIAVGLEGKYYITDDISDDFDSALDAFALMATLGFSR